MNTPVARFRGPSRAAGVLGLVGGLLLTARPAAALSPDSPEVRAAVARGVAYLEGQNAGGLGMEALVGLTLVKSAAQRDHPKVKQALTTIQGALQGSVQNFNADIYSTSVAILFLVAVDPQQYHYDIEALATSLRNRQKPPGAWGYRADNKDHGKTCDTSMTQFAAMALWEAADQARVETPPDVWEKAARWLLQTQDPNGGFGYQGVVSDVLGDRVKQTDTLHSMTCAGLCSLYIAKDQLGLSRLRRKSNDDAPAALQPLETDAEAKARIKTKLDPRLFNKARADGNHWMSEHFTIDKPKGWLHYYLYALERYETLREGEQGTPSTVPWYDRGAKFLLDTQISNGSWKSQAPEPADTCFAILFLVRSTKKSLERSRVKHPAAVLIGGRGVPAEGPLRLRRGQLAAPAARGSLEELLPLLETADHPRHAEALEALADLADAADRATLERHAAALRRLATNGDREVRRAAIRALGRSHNLDHAPTLIARLEDADVEVVAAARDALVRISRRLDGFGFNVRGSATSRREAVARWKNWYRSIRPDATFD